MKILNYIKSKFYKHEVKTYLSDETEVSDEIEVPKNRKCNMILSCINTFMVRGYVDIIDKNTVEITIDYYNEDLKDEMYYCMKKYNHFNCIYSFGYEKAMYIFGYIKEHRVVHLMHGSNVFIFKVVLNEIHDKYKSIEFIDNYVKLSNEQYVAVRTMEIVTDEQTINLLNMIK